MSSRIRRCLLPALMAFVVFAVVTEAGLQVLGLVTRAGLQDRLAREPDAQAFTILCVGDSHTYGASLPEEQSYPSQLASLLETHYAPRRFRVINAGFPGVNSAFVANRLEDQLLRYRPNLVIVWVGTNNRWNSLETESWERDGGFRTADRILLRLKLYRLAKVLWAWRSPGSADAGEVGRRVRAGDAPPTAQQSPVSETRAHKLADDEVQHGIRHDLEKMAELARAWSTPIVFTTYPLPAMAGPNRAILATAQRVGVPVIATALDYRRALEEGHAPTDLILHAAGPHPTGILYGYVAESMLGAVSALLTGAEGPDLRAGHSPNAAQPPAPVR